MVTTVLVLPLFPHWHISGVVACKDGSRQRQHLIVPGTVISGSPCQVAVYMVFLSLRSAQLPQSGLNAWHPTFSCSALALKHAHAAAKIVYPQQPTNDLCGLGLDSFHRVLAVLADNQHVASLWWVIVSPAHVLVHKGRKCLSFHRVQ